MARVVETSRPSKTEDPFISMVKEYQFVKTQAETLAARQKELRDVIIETVDALGEEDENGHIFLELPDQIDGVRGLQKTRRVTKKFLDETAAEILRDADLEERCMPLVRVVDPDEVLAAKNEDLLTEEQLESMYEVKTTWALNLK